MLGNAYKLIAFASYSTIGGAGVIAGSAVRNCSLFWNTPTLGSVNIRVGTPGPLALANTPANLATEWSRGIGNLLPIVTSGTAAVSLTLTQVNDTTYQILAVDTAGAAADAVVWFGLFTLAV